MTTGPRHIHSNFFCYEQRPSGVLQLPFSQFIIEYRARRRFFDYRYRKENDMPSDAENKPHDRSAFCSSFTCHMHFSLHGILAPYEKQACSNYCHSTHVLLCALQKSPPILYSTSTSCGYAKPHQPSSLAHSANLSSAASSTPSNLQRLEVEAKPNQNAPERARTVPESNNLSE